LLALCQVVFTLALHGLDALTVRDPLRFGHGRVRLAAPVLRKALAPVAKRPCGDAVGVQHVPAVFVGGFAAGAEPVDYAVVNDFSRWCQSRRCNGLPELFDQVVHGVLPFGRWGQLGGGVFGLGGAGHAAIGVHPGIYIGLKVEDATAFDELWAVAVAAHHGQSLVRKAGVLRGIARIHAAIRVSDYFDGLDLRLGHDFDV
jgi:hypothetical protein